MAIEYQRYAKVSSNKAITASTSEQTDIDVANYLTVSVSPTPSESKTVTSNGTVTPTSGKLLSSVVVNVPQPSGTKSITAGTSSKTEDVTDYASVTVSPTPSESKTVTENGTVTPSSGKLLSSVVVNLSYNTYLTGSGEPSSDLGNNGDVYFDLDS